MMVNGSPGPAPIEGERRLQGARRRRTLPEPRECRQRGLTDGEAAARGGTAGGEGQGRSGTPVVG